MTIALVIAGAAALWGIALLGYYRRHGPPK